MKKQEFYDKAKELFGEDFNDWKFSCSFCRFEQSKNSILKIIKVRGYHESKRYGKLTLENINKLKPAIDQECLSPTCNYVAYGLIPSTFCSDNEGIEVDGTYHFNFAIQDSPKVQQK